MFSFLTAHQVDPVGGINIKSVFLNMKERPSCCLASQTRCFLITQTSAAKRGNGDNTGRPLKVKARRSVTVKAEASLSSVFVLVSFSYSALRSM